MKLEDLSIMQMLVESIISDTDWDANYVQHTYATILYMKQFQQLPNKNS
jgi:hypothetical protein